jgi:hypothetical protein
MTLPSAKGQPTRAESVYLCKDDELVINVQLPCPCYARPYPQDKKNQGNRKKNRNGDDVLLGVVRVRIGGVHRARASLLA